jgi:tetratricopeptide (TPR) repeat protein
MSKYILTAVVVFVSTLSNAQKTATFYDIHRHYYEALELFQKEKYVAAQEKFDQYILAESNPKSELRVNAEYYRGICSLYLFHKDAEFDLERFVQDHPDSPWVWHVYYQLATHNYKKKSYKKALEWFDKVEMDGLSQDQLTEVYYKRGYSYFETDQFEKARKDFYEVKDIPGEYQNAAIYYYSHISYEEKNYQTALEGFRKLENDPSFSPVVPYYITQILYSQGKYDELLAYAPGVLENAKVNTTKRVPEIARLIGDAYYRKEKFTEALPYLLMYHEETNKSDKSSEDFYQLGYTYYRTAEYAKALDSFSNCTAANDSLDQMATYNMGDCYLKLDQKTYARNAFKEAADLDFNLPIKEDALFNYAKLAFELSYNPFHEAITAFEGYLEKYPNSPRRDEAYEFLLNVYMKTRNYEAALKSLDKIANKDARTKEAYQVVAYNRGVELFQTGSYSESDKFFDKVATYPINPEITAEAIFWKAESAYKQKDYGKAHSLYTNFTAMPGAYASAFYGMGQYGDGYALFKQGIGVDGTDNQSIQLRNEKFAAANSAFRKYSDGPGTKDSKKLADAYMRIGDCFYATKEYGQAIAYYDKGVATSESQKDYASFQKAICYGLNDQNDKKAWVLKNMLAEMPNSEYAIEAKYELASTYMQDDRVNEAETYYKDVVNNHPNSPFKKPSLLGLCLVYTKKDDVANAKETWNTMKNTYPNDKVLKEAYNVLKAILIDDPQFVNDAQNITVLDVQTADLDDEVFKKAEGYALLGDCNNAIPKLNNYLQQYNPAIHKVEANYYLAECYWNKDDKANALLACNEVLKSPSNEYTVSCVIMASTIQYNNKNYREALDLYIKLEQISTTDLLEAQIGQMRCNYLLGEMADAKKYANLVIANSGTPDEIKRTAILWRGRILLAEEDYTGATADFKEVIKKGGVMAAESKYHIAFILNATEQFTKCETECFELIEKYSSFDEWKFKTFLLLADNYISMKDYFNARATLEAIIENVSEQWVLDEANSKLQYLNQIEAAEQGNRSEEPIEINVGNE